MIRTGIVFAALAALSAVSCGDGEKPAADSSKPATSTAAKSSKPAVSASAKPAASTASSAAPSSSAEADACPPNEKWAPKPAKDVKFEWSDKPKLEQAPKEGVFASVGGEPFQLEEISISVDDKQKEWTLSGKAGPLGPNLIIKGEPKAGATVDEKFGSNRGYFQVPSKLDMAECFKQTTSYNGENARLIKLTKYDAKTKLADGVFVTTWQEGFDKKRKFWAAGTFKDAKVNIY